MYCVGHRCRLGRTPGELRSGVYQYYSDCEIYPRRPCSKQYFSCAGYVIQEQRSQIKLSTVDDVLFCL